MVTLGREAWLFFRLPEVNLLEFLTGTTWQPHIQEFGILPLATATLVTTAIAMVIAIPLGLTVAIFLSEYAPRNVRELVSPVIDLLAGIPSIVYGLWGFYVLRPFLIDIGFENQGFGDEEIMLLYHFNTGYPLLDEGAEFVAPSRTQTARDAASAAAKGESNLFVMDAPRDCYPEQVFYHDLKADESGNTFCALKNSRLGIALKLSFNKNELPFLTQWKSIASGDYVLGMEPGNCHVEGMEKERERGTLAVLKAGETRTCTITIDVLSGEEELKTLSSEVE